MARLTLIGDVLIPPWDVQLNVSLQGWVLGNLEAPLKDTKKAKFPPKAGPLLFSDRMPDFVNGWFLSLANNHTFDFGLAGYEKTKSAFDQIDVATAGAGRNYKEACAPLIKVVDGVRIGVLSRTDPQFQTASDDAAGVAPLDHNMYEDIRRLLKDVDVVVISMHGSGELFSMPSPAYQDHMRSLIDAGAHIIHGHHSHVPQGWEKYKHGLICYGLGNFCVDVPRFRRYKHADWSVIMEVTVSSNGIEKYVPKITEMRMEPNGTSMTVAFKDMTSDQQIYIEQINSVLRDRDELDAVWQNVSVCMYELYYRHYLYPSLWKRFKQFLKPFVFWRHPDGARSLSGRAYQHLLHYHLFMNDAHKQALSTALGVLSGELQDKRDTRSNVFLNQCMPWLVAGKKG